VQIELSEVQLEIQRVCREFAAKELTPNARRWDEEHHFPAEAVRALGSLGLMGVAVPEQWGGAGLDPVAYAVAMEEISRGCAGTGVIMSVNNSLWCDPVLKWGSEAQKAQFLTPFARGEKLGSFALTEPQSGSDAGEMKTRACLEGNEWVLNGAKNFITNGPQADAVLVFALTDPERKHRGISAFLVPGDAEGFSRGKPDSKLGIRASGSCSLFFEDCRIPEENLLGKAGEGFKIAMATLDGGRIGIAGQALGIARAALEEAIAYSKERRAFGKPICEHQAIQFMLADMATDLDAARLLVWHAAWLKSKDARHTAQASMAKLFASEMSGRVTHKAVQVLGGYGYIQEYDVERHFRDARITEIYEGTSEIQRLVISSQLLKE
jgi:butyryl-CoA dehydrogenase